MTIAPNTWQTQLLASFQPKEFMLVVIDPDNLLTDESLLAEIQNSSYDILQLEDEITFRNRFERRYRSRWDTGEQRHVVVIVHTTESTRHIPYDLLQKGKRIEVSVSALFSQLNALTLRQLDRAYFNDLYSAHTSLLESGQKLHGERATLEFILRTAFGLDPALPPNPTCLVELLIQKHYLARALPTALEDYLTKKTFPQVTLDGLKADFLHSQADFYTWLDTAWAGFIQARATGQTSPNLFLNDQRLRPLLANLFAEGLLTRIPTPADLPASNWLSIGLLPASGKRNVGEWTSAELYNLNTRLKRFVELDASSLPQGKTDLRDWLNLATEWAEAVYQANSLPGELYKEAFPALSAARIALDEHFSAFIQARYSAVDYYQDNLGPISLAGVNNWLNQAVPTEDRLALVCFDGLALDQWILLRDYLQSKLPDLVINENRTYAIAPTITPISRQALFSGRPPVNFSETWDKTNQDADRWQAWWVHHEVPPLRVKHLSIKASAPDYAALGEVISSKNVRLGILINLFDDVMHAVKELPPHSDKRIYYDTLRSYLDNGTLDSLFTALLTGGYRIFITSDHGNLAGIGNGITPPKALIETYARRVAIFDNEPLARDFAEQKDGIYFRTKSLPPDVQPVYPTGNQLYASKASVQISHGGLSIEELVVPFIEISQKRFA
jgi:hypothetical protein